MKKQSVLAIVTLLFAMFGCGHARAESVSMLGEQDFADGEIVFSSTTWLNAQSNESLLTAGIYVAPITISYAHTGLNPGLSGTLTFSLWDLNSDAPGNQVTDFRLDNISQPIGGFETGERARNEFFQFPVAGSMLADGEVQVAITLGPSAVWAGLDFSRLEVVPEPGAIALGSLGLVSLIVSVRRRKSLSAVRAGC